MTLRRETKKVRERVKVADARSRRVRKLKDAQPSNEKIMRAKEIFEELKRVNPKLVLNAEILAREISRNANLPYTKAYTIANNLIFMQRMKK